VAGQGSPQLDKFGFSFDEGVNEFVVYYDTLEFGPTYAYDFSLPDISGEGFAITTFTASPSVTPLPAALPLFATGIGAMSLLGWRRKRKDAAAVAVA
jgi:hypothetical protein